MLRTAPLLAAAARRGVTLPARRALATAPAAEGFVFTAENFSNPELPHGLHVVDVPLVEATDEALEGFGCIIHSADERTVEKGNFEILPWPVQVLSTAPPPPHPQLDFTSGQGCG